MQSLLTPLGLFIDRYSSNGFESLVATTRATKTPAVFLVAHLDVVPAEDELFSLERVGTNLVGRGAYDMKYAAACFLHLVEDLKDNLKDYDLGIMFTMDEELGGADGVKYLIGQGYGCDVCFVPDGGDNWRLESVAKGAYWMAVDAVGISAHGSRPWDGDNACDRLMDFLGDLRQITVGKLHTDPTIVVTRISGGAAMNQVPDSATALVDIRYANKPQLDDMVDQVKVLAKKHRVECTNYETASEVNLDVTVPLVQRWEQIVGEVRGTPADEYAMSFGASDVRYFAEKGIPAIVTRPIGGDIHSEKEWIDEAGFYQFYECLRQYTEAVARRPLDETASTGYTEDKLPETVTDS